MKIIIDEKTKEGVLVKEDGTEVSRYSYKSLIDSEFTMDMFKQDIDNFNITLGQLEEFDDIKELTTAIKIHSW